jgi:putative ABC transport system substrate-binding protein
MKAKVFGLILCALLYVLCASVKAQQPKRIFRIGYITLASASSNLPRREAFLQGMRNLGYVEGHNFKLSTAMPTVEVSGFPNSQPIWCVLGWM